MPTDAWKEVARIVAGVVQDGASKIPAGEKGAVLLRAGWHAPVEALVGELQRWMYSEGEGVN